MALWDGYVSCVNDEKKVHDFPQFVLIKRIVSPYDRGILEKEVAFSGAVT